MNLCPNNHRRRFSTEVFICEHCAWVTQRDPLTDDVQGWSPSEGAFFDAEFDADRDPLESFALRAIGTFEDEDEPERASIRRSPPRRRAVSQARARGPSAGDLLDFLPNPA